MKRSAWGGSVAPVAFITQDPISNGRKRQGIRVEERTVISVRSAPREIVVGESGNSA